ncbi:DELLA protein GAIP [Senna tora]|uniref:DELLA protein GAIP n=1 Tax=Senna tora TaxID=362788 RepID=A0A834WXU7_9FABA|nr:DELLA protein GAIP [Senna tora]
MSDDLTHSLFKLFELLGHFRHVRRPHLVLKHGRSLSISHRLFVVPPLPISLISHSNSQQWKISLPLKYTRAPSHSLSASSFRFPPLQREPAAVGIFPASHRVSTTSIAAKVQMAPKNSRVSYRPTLDEVWAEVNSKKLLQERKFEPDRDVLFYNQLRSV